MNLRSGVGGRVRQVVRFYAIDGSMDSAAIWRKSGSMRCGPFALILHEQGWSIESWTRHPKPSAEPPYSLSPWQSMFRRQDPNFPGSVPGFRFAKRAHAIEPYGFALERSDVRFDEDRSYSTWCAMGSMVRVGMAAIRFAKRSHAIGAQDFAIGRKVFGFVDGPIVSEEDLDPLEGDEPRSWNSVSQSERRRLGRNALRRNHGAWFSNRPVDFGTIADVTDPDAAASWNSVSQCDRIIMNSIRLRRILRRSQSDLSGFEGRFVN